MQTQVGLGIRPRRIGELLDLTFRVYRRGFRYFAIIGIVITSTTFVFGLLWQMALFSSLGVTTTGGGDPAAFLFFMVVGVLVLGLLTTLTYGAGMMAVSVVVENELLGGELPFRDLVRRTLKRTLPAAWTAVLVWAAMAVGVLLCFVPGIIAMILLALALPIVYLENRSGFTALRRSIDLVLRRGQRGLSVETNWVRVLAVLVVTLAVLYTLNFLAALPGAAANFAGAMSQRPPLETVLGPQFVPLWALIPLEVLASIIQGLFATLGIIPWPLVYFDIRARHEGLDLELAVERLRAGVSA